MKVSIVFDIQVLPLGSIIVGRIGNQFLPRLYPHSPILLSDCTRPTDTGADSQMCA